MAVVDFLHHENPPTWAGVEPATLVADGQRQINYATHLAIAEFSFANPTPLAHADTSRDVLTRGGTSQWRPTRFNLYGPEMRKARGFNVWPEVYFSRSENVTEFLEDIDN
ncbi:uncharacterized protein TNCV_3936241 [Trichonephila clavipes]|nr:uncharacterized protein TNCV_3936241 [Trichonephila clavipes]